VGEKVAPIFKQLAIVFGNKEFIGHNNKQWSVSYFFSVRP